MNEPARLSASVSTRLSVMMFIQFYIWGAWYVTAPKVLGPLGFDGGDFGWTYSVGPIAGMISPFFVGMIADRFFSTERVLAVMHLLGAAAMFGAIDQMRAAEPSPTTINLLFFLHMLCYFPTLSLTNTLAMHTMTDSAKQFPLIRVFGTIGWIVANLTLSWFGWTASIDMFYLAAGAGAILAVFSLFLPHVPPPAAGQRFSVGEVLGLDALVLLKKPSFAIFMASSFLICIPLAFYYQLAERTITAGGVGSVVKPATAMSFGQMSEILFMVAMPFFFRRLGVKWMLFVGMLAWVVRYVLFALGTENEVISLLLIGVILHGICYDFFFVTGQIYTDQTAPTKIRGQAQGMLVLFTLGLGMFIGAQIAGKVETDYTGEEAGPLNAQVQTMNEEIEALKASRADAASPADVETQISALETRRDEVQVQALRQLDWVSIWTYPAAGAAIVLILFTIFFRQPRKKEDGGEDDGS